MKKTRQRYCLIFHSRIVEAVSAVDKYSRFFAQIKDIPAPWGPSGRPAPTLDLECRDLPEISSASVDLTRYFGDGVKSAVMLFGFRRMLENSGSRDDRFCVDINPAKVDLHHLIYTVIPSYVEAFDAYKVDYFDERFVLLAYEERVEEGRTTYTPKSREYINPRFKVETVEVVSFYDELLCRRAFNLTPAEVVERLKGKVEFARLLHNGVYIVGTSRVLPLNDVQELCGQMKAALES